jgi:two-component system, OmpR family, KDP operon response regulator KdpE
VTRVLLVEDELQLLRALDVNLRARGYEVHKVMTGEEALREASSSQPDVVLLDLGLPGLDGIDVIRGLRTWTETPIIVLSARDAEHDKVTALDVGADDYVTKPFSMAELLARLRAAVRRNSTADAVVPVITEDFTIDLMGRRVTRPSGARVRLTPTEWQIVEILARNEGLLVMQKDLLHAVWGPLHERHTNYLRVHMAHIRSKLEPRPADPRYFHTEAGMGYRFVRG